MNTGAVAFALFAGWMLTEQWGKRRAVEASQLAALIQDINLRYFGGWFDWRDVAAVVQVESSGNPDAYRYEAALGESSIGLMQTLYSTAVDRGYTGGPAGLLDPATSLYYGMAQLKWSFDYLSGRLARTPTLDEWIGSYNAGVGNVLKGFIPAEYVERWKSARLKFSA